MDSMQPRFQQGYDGTKGGLEKGKTNPIKNDIKFCRECGQSIAYNDRYCSKCGEFLYAVKNGSSPPREGIAGMVRPKPETRDIHKRMDVDIKGTIIHSAMALGIVFLISLLLSGLINAAAMESVMDIDIVNPGIKLINAFDLTLLSNLSKIKITLSVLNEENMNMSGIMPVFLIMPIIIFFVMGVLKAKKDDKLQKSFNFMNTLALSICYGLMLGIISIISIRSYKIGGGILGIEATFKKTHSFSLPIINGILISIISQILGYATYAKCKKRASLIESFEWLLDSAFFIVASLVGIFMITSILLLTGILEIDAGPIYTGEMGSLSKILINILFSAYVLLMACLGTFHFKSIGGSVDGYLDLFDSFMDHEMAFKSSLIKGVEDLRSYIDSRAMFIIGLAILIPVIAFFVKGIRAKKQGYKGIVRSVFLPTLSYSLIMGLLAYLTGFRFSGGISELGGFESVVGKPTANMFLGFKFISTFFGSFILTTISAMAGFLLSKEERV